MALVRGLEPLRLLHRPTGTGVVLGVPSGQPAFAFHICRYMVEEPPPARRVVHIPKRPADPHVSGALAAEALFLPDRFLVDTWMAAPPGLEPGLVTFWTDLPDVPFTVPLAVHQRRQFDRSWRIETVCTPHETGLAISPTEQSEVGWAVLARANKVNAIEVLALLACRLEIVGRDPFVVGLVEQMGLPAPYYGRLLAAARGGQPVFDPKALRWMIAELVAAEQSELEARANWTPAGHSGADLLASAWFPWLRSPTGRPTTADVLRAIWLLHEDFHGAEGSFTDPDGVLAGITALGYATAQEGSWLPKLDRWSRIWDVDDSHPAVQTASHAPSALRAIFTSVLGLTPSEWLAGTWFVCCEWLVRIPPNGRLRMQPDELYAPTLDGHQIDLSAEFTKAFDEHLVDDLDNVGMEVRRTVGYRGLGTLPQTDPVACRNRPVLRIPDGSLVPISLELVADRAAVLWRFLLPARLKGARSGIAALGYQFEAYITDMLQTRIGPRHRVLTEADISSVLGDETRCDQVVVHGDEWLFIENSLITLNRGVAGGTLSAVENLCQRYHAEADQASATAAQADRLAAAFGLPKPRMSTILVVTDNPAAHSPALMQQLWEQRPDRNPRLLCSARELEALVELAAIGWSMPGAIVGWQHQEVEGPLQTAIHNMAGIASSTVSPPTSVQEWLARIPRRRAPAA